MPLLDMPLDKLKAYQGRNPRPADHDAYWTRALAELDATPPAARFDQAPMQFPGVITKDVWFAGVGGARVHAKYARPANATGRTPCVLLFHGYSSSSGDWLGLLAWVAMGATVLSLDVRGQGGQSQDVHAVDGWTLQGHIVRGLGDKPDRLLFRAIFLDCAQMARIALALPEVDPLRVVAHGGSQGGGLTLACAALEPRVSRAAPVFPFLCDYRRVWEMDLAKDAYNEIREWFRRFDPLHLREEEIFNNLGYIDCQFLAPRIRANVLMGVGLMDNICPPSTQFAAWNKMTCKKDLLIYPDFGHEGLPGANDRFAQFLLG
jgi:cephalosporin-C deacetylase